MGSIARNETWAAWIPGTSPIELIIQHSQTVLPDQVNAAEHHCAFWAPEP
jgi:hypothetical protein